MAYPNEIISNVLFYVTVSVFTLIGLYAGRNGVTDKDIFLTARSSQNWISLGINFFAAGLGVWTFFALPQVGSSTGILGVFAYSISIVIPLLALGILGPLLRKRLPDGVTITEFILMRFGKAASILANVITLLYMSVFLISELTALGALLESYHIYVLWAQIVVCASTALYTCLSGMKASLLTDKFQGWIVVLLVFIVTIAIGLNVRLLPEKMKDSDLLKPSQIAWESLFTLTIANLSANIFHQGYWQRVYSAKDNNNLIKASILASLLSFPVIFLIGLSGVFSVWAGLSEQDNALAFFNITATLPAWINAFVLVLAVAFVSSSVDTLQNAIVATLVNDIFLNKVSLNVARAISVLINIPVIVLAAKGYDILSLFLIADLAAAVVVCPVLFGLIASPTETIGASSDRNMDPKLRNKELASVITERLQIKLPTSISPPHFRQVLKTVPNGFDFCVAVVGGVFAVVIFGTVLSGGDWLYGVQLLSLPNGLTKSGESLGAFITAPVGSMLCFGLSWLIRGIIFH